MNVNFHVNLGRKCHLRPFTSKIKNACRCIKGRICGRYDLITHIFLNISVTTGGMTLKFYLKVKRDKKISKKEKK